MGGEGRMEQKRKMRRDGSPDSLKNLSKKNKKIKKSCFAKTQYV